MQITPFEWIATHLQLIGWPAVTMAAYKVGRFVTRLEERWVDLEDQVAKVIRTQEIFATNHVPHIELSIDKMVATMTELRDDIHEFLFR